MSCIHIYSLDTREMHTHMHSLEKHAMNTHIHSLETHAIKINYSFSRYTCHEYTHPFFKHRDTCNECPELLLPSSAGSLGPGSAAPPCLGLL